MIKRSIYQQVALFALVFVACRSSDVVHGGDSLMPRQCDDAACHCIISDSPCICRIGDRVPPGTLASRMPYDTFRVYYYRRPYQAVHVEQHLSDSAPPGSRPYQPYATPWLGEIYDQVERQAVQEWIDDQLITATVREDLIKKDRPLEYVDWKAYRKARQHWEALQTGRPVR